MKKYLKNYIIVFIIVLFLSLIIFKLNSPSDRIIGKVVNVKRTSVNNVITGNASISIPLTGDINTSVYVNVLIDLNQNYKWAPYITTNELVQEEWIVRNMATKLTTEQINNFSFNLNDINISLKKNLNALIMVSEFPVDDWKGEKLKGALIKNVVVKKIYHQDIENAYSLEDVEGSGWSLKTKSKNTDLAVFRTNVPDIDQETNECAIASTANSYIWLADNFYFSKELPNNKALFYNLKNHTKWGLDHGVYMKTDYLHGLNTFNEKYKLPIISYPLSTPFDKNLFDIMLKELILERDITIDLEVRNSSNRRIGGHVVTLIGLQKRDDEKFIYIHDPLTTGKEIDIYKILDNNKIVNYIYNDNTYLRLGFADAFIHDFDYKSGTIQKEFTVNFNEIKKIPYKIGELKIITNNDNHYWKIFKNDFSDILNIPVDNGIGSNKIDIYLNKIYQKEFEENITVLFMNEKEQIYRYQKIKINVVNN